MKLRKKIYKKTGRKWCEVLKIRIINPSGWTTETDFNINLIDKEEFLNRAANSVIAPIGANSRREVNVLKKYYKT